MPRPDSGSCCASLPSEEAATLGQLSAQLSLHVLCCSSMPSCGINHKGSNQTEGWHAGREVLQQVANKLSIIQWVRTLSLVRFG